MEFISQRLVVIDEQLEDLKHDKSNEMNLPEIVDAVTPKDNRQTAEKLINDQTEPFKM